MSMRLKVPLILGLYRLRQKYRDTTFFSLDGNCNGFSFLYSFYAALGMEQYYFNTLALMANWDGSEATLQSQFDKNVPQAQFYNNLDELFEQWTNDLIWLQHSKLTEVDGLDQGDRVEQYSIIKKKGQGDYFLLYQEPKICFDENHHPINYERTEGQLREIFSYLKRMPANVQFVLSGEGHATSSNINKEGILVYYDSNFKHKTENTEDLNQIIQRIIDYKYILLEKFDSTVYCVLGVYCYQKDLPQIKFDNFSVLDEKELPKSQEDALAFQQNSANHFTPLHIAVMTRSLATLQRLLKDGFCLVISKCNKEIINSTLINFTPLLKHFMYYRQFHRIASLIEKRAHVDSLFPSGNTPLMRLIKMENMPEKYDLIPLLIQYGSDLTIKNKEGKTAIDLVNESNDDQIKQIFYEHGLIERESIGMKMN
jgi:hypothetical protein